MNDRVRLRQQLNIAFGRAGSSAGPFRFRSLTIDSDNGWFRAQLDDAPDGIVVTVWERRSGGVWRRIYRDELDAPWHVACDGVHDVINALTRGLA